jgi:hypothetical protein
MRRAVYFQCDEFLRRGRGLNFLIAFVITMEGACERDYENRRQYGPDCYRERFHFGFLFDFAGFSRTPCPSSRNSTPAFSSAARMASPLASVIDGGPSVASALLTVATPSFACFAKARTNGCRQFQ